MGLFPSGLFDLRRQAKNGLLNLVGWTNHHHATVGAGNGAANEDDVVFGIDVDDVEITDGDLLGAVLSGHFLTLFGTTETPVGRDIGTTDGAVYFLHTVARGETGKVPTLHGTGEATALGGADDIDALDFAEDFRDGQLVAYLALGGFVEAELFDEFLGFAVGLGRKGGSGGKTLATLGFHFLGDMATLGAGGAFAALVLVADLNGFVAILFLGANLKDGARTSLDYGDGGAVALGVVNLGHAYFGADDTD